MLKPKYRYSQAHVGLGADRPVSVDRQHYEGEYPVPAHDHEFYEIALVTRGWMTHTTDVGTDQLPKGTVLILSPMSVHSYVGHRGLELCNILYLGEWFLADVRALRGTENLVPLFFEKLMFARTEAPPVVRINPEPAEFARLIDEIADMERRGPKGSLLYLESCFLKLIDELARIYGRQYGRDFTRPMRSEVTRGLAIIESLVALHGEFLAPQVARQAGLSHTRFDVLFREHTGMSPTDYFQRHRVQHVCRRLLATSLTVAEIAQEFNYSDAAHLNRYFRRYQRMTPSAYRRRFGSGSLVSWSGIAE